MTLYHCTTCCAIYTKDRAWFRCGIMRDIGGTLFCNGTIEPVEIPLTPNVKTK